jgi:hypothetical protein
MRSPAKIGFVRADLKSVSQQSLIDAARVRVDVLAAWFPVAIGHNAEL